MPNSSCVCPKKRVNLSQLTFVVQQNSHDRPSPIWISRRVMWSFDKAGAPKVQQIGLNSIKRLRCSIGGLYHGSFMVDGMLFLFLLDYIQGHENGIQGHCARGADDYNQIASFTTFCFAKNVTWLFTDNSQGTGVECDLRCRWDRWFFLHSLWWRGPTVLSKWWGLYRVSPCVSSNVTQETFPQKNQKIDQITVCSFHDGERWKKWASRMIYDSLAIIRSSHKTPAAQSN